MLSNEEILQHMSPGDIIIHPFNKRNLGPNSYDVTLGEYYYKEQMPNEDDGLNLYNIFDEEHVNRVWGSVKKAPACDYWSTFYKNIGPSDKVILLGPGDSILAHTNEFIGGKNTFTSSMRARSSYGRNFITVCRCAGLGDVGYFNRWTMEITNNSKYYTIPLIVGRRIAQITFDKTGKAIDYVERGKYQDSNDLQVLIDAWKPEMMLPKLYNDWELRD